MTGRAVGGVELCSGDGAGWGDAGWGLTGFGRGMEERVVNVPYNNMAYRTFPHKYFFKNDSLCRHKKKAFYRYLIRQLDVIRSTSRMWYSWHQGW